MKDGPMVHNILVIMLMAKKKVMENSSGQMEMSIKETSLRIKLKEKENISGKISENSMENGKTIK